MFINREEYSEFIKDDYKMQFVLSLEEEKEIVSRIINIIKNYLEALKQEDKIETYSLVGNRFEIKAHKYDIYVLVLHCGDVYQYTINKRTKKKANYDKRMGIDPLAVKGMLNSFI